MGCCMTITCPHCRKALKGKDEFAGRSVTCPACKQLFDIPILADAVEDTQVPPAPPPSPPSVLPSMPEQPSQPRTSGRVFDTPFAVGLRFDRASARGWSALDRTSRVLVVCAAVGAICAVGIVSLFLLLFLPTVSRALDPRIDEAYGVQKRFATDYVHTLAGCWWQPSDLQFSPLTDTRIVRNGNYFRIRGWVVHTTYKRQICYTLEMELDPKLDVWKLVGNVEQVR